MGSLNSYNGLDAPARHQLTLSGHDREAAGYSAIASIVLLGGPHDRYDRHDRDDDPTATSASEIRESA